jgi:hypothetical protein
MSHPSHSPVGKIRVTHLQKEAALIIGLRLRLLRLLLRLLRLLLLRLLLLRLLLLRLLLLLLLLLTLDSMHSLLLLLLTPSLFFPSPSRLLSLLSIHDKKDQRRCETDDRKTFP